MEPLLHLRYGRARLLSRFLREARIAGQLSHPGIVPVHELGRLPDGTVYFTMPVVRGDDLNAVSHGAARARAIGPSPAPSA